MLVGGTHKEATHRPADGPEPLQISWVVTHGVEVLIQGGNGHWSLTLAIELSEFISKAVHRGEDVLDVHWPPSVDHRLQIGRIALDRRHQHALHHGGRRKECEVGPRFDQFKDFSRFEPTAFRYDLAGAFHDMGKAIETSAMADGRGVQHC